VVSRRLRDEEFGAGEPALGRTIRVGAATFTIVGVARSDFNGLGGAERRDLWIPLGAAALLPGAVGQAAARPDERLLAGVVRIPDASTLETVRDAVRRALTGVVAADRSAPADVQLPTMGAALDADETTAALPALVVAILLGATLLVLTFANAGNLLLARGMVRQHQFGVLAALGATRRHLAALVVAEGIVCAAGAACAGVATAGVALHRVARQSPTVAFALDWRAATFGALLAALCAAAFSLPAALRATRDVNASLRAGGNATPPGRVRLQTTFVSLQLAGSLAALAVSGMFVLALRGTVSADTGYAHAGRIGVLTYDASLLDYTATRETALRERLVAALAEHPGVERVTYADVMPFSSRNVAAEWKRSAAADVADVTSWRAYVAHSYFETLGIERLGGRGFTAEDARGPTRTAVVNEAFSRRYFGGAGAVGKMLWTPDGESVQIVGVVRTARYHTLAESARPFVYLPFGDATPNVSEVTIFAEWRRTAAPMQRIATALVRNIDPDLPVRRASDFAAVIRERNGPAELTAAILGALGLLATIIATAGVLAVSAYVAAARERELAIRSALGARRDQIVRLMLARGVPLVIGGLAGGVALTGMSLPALRAMVGEVGDASIEAFVLAVVLLAIAVTLGLLVPALRASRISPMEALRHE
jgi:predicted permease